MKSLCLFLVFPLGIVFLGIFKQINFSVTNTTYTVNSLNLLIFHNYLLLKKSPPPQRPHTRGLQSFYPIQYLFKFIIIFSKTKSKILVQELHKNAIFGSIFLWQTQNQQQKNFLTQSCL